MAWKSKKVLLWRGRALRTEAKPIINIRLGLVTPVLPVPA